MFESIKEGVRLFFKSRYTVAVFVMIGLFGLLLWRVFYLQVVNGEEYQDNYTLKIVKERTLNSTRGNIYDRNGKLIAYNELAYSITIEDNGTYVSTKAKNAALNAEIAQIITALEANGDAIINDFKIDLNSDGTYSYNVSGTSWKRFLADVYGKNSYKDLSFDKERGYDRANATEQQVMDYLAEKYGIHTEDEKYLTEYDREMAYKITVVRFAIAQNAYQKYIRTTIATDVSEQTVAYISEHSNELQGVEVEADTIRKYDYSEYITSIIGYTGKISQEEYERLSAEDDSYTPNDVIGKGGIEQYMDAELKGEKGYEKLYVDYLGKTIEVIDREEPVAGNDVYLSIDIDYQVAAYDILEQEIAGIVYANIENYSSDINIPIEDVYFALINNNVINFQEFTREDASDTEKAVHQVFLSRQSAIFEELWEELTGSTGTVFSKMNDEKQDYITYIIDRLKKTKILLESNIDSTDEVYVKWKQGAIRPKEYLSHAISKGWIDITQFTVEEKYADSSELYEDLCTYILDKFATERGFSKIIYEYLIQGGSVTGQQLCLILFDQEVLAYDDEDIAALSGRTVSAKSFIKEKIKSLEITPAQLALDPCAGSCVITDIETGEVLALVTYPGYDGNRMANTVDAEYFNSLQNDLSLPQYNYATQQKTAPGSTFKMIMAAAGMVEGYIDISEKIQDKGEYENVSNRPKCWIFPSAHGFINVSEALRDSCNYYFYEVGYRLSTNNYTSTYSDSAGIATIEKYASMFGLDETTGIEIVENEPEIADEYPVMAAIGQSNNNYTTVQLARYVTAVANRGTVYQYTLLKRVEDARGNVVKTYAPKVRNTVDVLSDAEWDAIHSGMRMVVENTKEFEGFPISAAGKTGTAQENLKRANHALFVGYAPYENPEISIATRIAYGYTSHNAAEVARNVFSYYFKVEDEEEILTGQAAEIDASSNQISD